MNEYIIQGLKLYIENIMPKVSIIIPVYNTEPYLTRCLDSIINQTLKDIEIICVDDCSTDNSSALLEQYAKSDSRIKVIHFENNLGVSKARNAGLAISTGDYIGFVDSDDYISVNFYEDLYACAKSENSQIAKGLTLHKTLEDLLVIYTQPVEIKKDKKKFSSEFYSAIYERNLIIGNNILFPPDMSAGEDLIFLLHAVYGANAIAVSDKAIYNYIRRESSADSPIISLERAKIILYSWQRVISAINTLENSDDIYVDRYLLCIQQCFNLFDRIVEDDKAQMFINIAETMIAMYSERRDSELLNKALFEYFDNSIAHIYYMYVQNKYKLAKLLTGELTISASEKKIIILKVKSKLNLGDLDISW